MMTLGEKYKTLDVADYLHDLDDVVGYLEIALEDSTEDPTPVPRALADHERTRPTRWDEPRRSPQGTVRRRQPHLVNHPHGHRSLGLRFELHPVA